MRLAPPGMRFRVVCGGCENNLNLVAIRYLSCRVIDERRLFAKSLSQFCSRPIAKDNPNAVLGTLLSIFYLSYTSQGEWQRSMCLNPCGRAQYPTSHHYTGVEDLLQNRNF